MAIDETRARLLDAAGREFAAKGFEGATVRAICDRAGVNLAAVNYHFGDKERLYEAVLMLAHRTAPGLDSSALAAALAALEPREALRYYVTDFLGRMVSQQQIPWHQEVMFREIAQPSRASTILVDEAIRPHFERLLAILRRLGLSSDERRLVATGLSVIGQCLHYKTSGPITEQIVGPEVFQRLDPDYLADHIATLTLAALGQGPPITEPPAVDAAAIPQPVRGER